MYMYMYMYTENSLQYSTKSVCFSKIGLRDHAERDFTVIINPFVQSTEEMMQS